MGSVFLIIALAATVSSGVVQAPETPSGTVARPVLTSRDFVQDIRPSSARPRFPERLTRQHLDFKVSATCDIGEDGSLRQCAINEEQPTDYGLGAMLLDYARAFRLPALDKSGEPTVGRKFRLGIVVHAAPPPT